MGAGHWPSWFMSDFKHPQDGVNVLRNPDVSYSVKTMQEYITLVGLEMLALQHKPWPMRSLCREWSSKAPLWLVLL